jgi:hypothetical protein
MEKFEGGKTLCMDYDVFTTRKMSPLKKQKNILISILLVLGIYSFRRTKKQ